MSDTTPERIGKQIRGCRTRAGMTQQGLAWEVGVHRTYISHLEAGRRDPSLETLRLMDHALGGCLVVRLGAVGEEFDDE